MGEQNNNNETVPTDNKIADEIAKVTRRLDSLEKTLSLLYEDRNILETIQGRLTSLEEEWRLTRQNDNQVRRDIKEEINIANDRTVASVETKVEEVKSIIDSRKVIRIDDRFGLIKFFKSFKFKSKI